MTTVSIVIAMFLPTRTVGEEDVREFEKFVRIAWRAIVIVVKLPLERDRSKEWNIKF